MCMAPQLKVSCMLACNNLTLSPSADRTAAWRVLAYPEVVLFGILPESPDGLWLADLGLGQAQEICQLLHMMQHYGLYLRL